jgi:hypothetical protein
MMQFGGSGDFVLDRQGFICFSRHFLCEIQHFLVKKVAPLVYESFVVVSRFAFAAIQSSYELQASSLLLLLSTRLLISLYVQVLEACGALSTLSL